MAKMHPPKPDYDAPSSERKVFDRLRDELPDSWTTLYARRFVLPPRPGQGADEGELDFLVINPNWGYLGLEVKGGGIERTPDGWISIDRKGAPHQIKDPGKQAQAAVHAIRKYLIGTPSSRAAMERVPFGWGVVFPDVRVTLDFGPDLPRRLVIDEGDFATLKESVDRICKHWSPSTADFPPASQQVLIRALAPTLRLVPTLASRLDEEGAVLVRLTDEQTRILDTLGEIRRLGIKGGAGTGKTIVAMEKARREAADGPRVLLLCFNRHLADYLAGKATGFTVKSFHALCRGLAKAAGVPFEPSESADESDFWATEAPTKLMEALDAYPDERYDVLIVDEGQDFLEYWWLAVEKLLKDTKKGILWVFYDPHQNIFGGGPAETLDLQPASLAWNCRNTKRIAAHASACVGVEPSLHPEAPDGVAVEEQICKNEPAMVEAVRKLLHRFVSDEKIPTDHIIVLSARSTNKSPVWKAKRLGNLTLVEFPARPGPGEIQFASLQRFKGLEEDVVILCDVEAGKETSSARHLYVGTSRARHVLVVLGYEPTSPSAGPKASSPV